MIRKILAFGFIINLISCEYFQMGESSKNRGYKLIENGIHPFPFKVYELDNGLQILLSDNNSNSRIHTQIGVKVGSKNDPIHATGLAHFIEHFMFNGTSKIGGTNWLKESELLNNLSDNFELIRNQFDPQKKDVYNKQIDSLFTACSSLGIAKEYEKLIYEIGGREIDGYTTFDETIFSNNIPSSELNKWAEIESERFNELVLRNFDIELEHIYKEYNMALNSDDDIVFNKLTEGLFPNHPYGKKTKFGEKRHLLNPSMKELHTFFDKFYTPNNMVISLSGDLDYESTIEIISKAFHKLEKGEDIKEASFSSTLNGEKRMNIFGQENNQFNLAYKLNGLKSENITHLEIIDRMFSNGYSGFFDSSKNGQSNFEDVYSFSSSFYDYSMFILGGLVTNKNNFETIENYIKSKIEKLKNGDYPEGFPQVCLNDIKKEKLIKNGSNYFRSSELIKAGLLNVSVSDYLNRFHNIKSISKNEISGFAKENFRDQKVVLNKRKGRVNNSKIVLPKTNSFKLRNGKKSNFYSNILSTKSVQRKSNFVDINETLQIKEGSNLICLENKSNDFFSLNFVFDFGSFDEPITTLALDYLNELIIKSKISDTSNKLFFENGLNWKIFSNHKSITIKLEGLNSNIENGVKALKEIFSKPVFDALTFNNFIRSIKKKRKDLEFDRSYLLWEGLLGKVQYSGKNPFVPVLTSTELSKVYKNDIIRALENLMKKPHNVFYYGPSDKKMIVDVLSQNFSFGEDVLKHKKERLKENTIQEEIFFVNNKESKHIDALFTAKKGMLNEDNVAFNLLFNTYFEKIGKRELRKHRTLSSDVYIGINESDTKGESDFVYGYVSCLVDNFPLALAGLEKLLKTNPSDVFVFEESKKEVLKTLNAKNLPNEMIFWEWKKNKRKGFLNNHHKNVLKEVEKLDFDHFVQIFDNQMISLNYSLLLIGDKTEINLDNLKDYGPLTNYTKHEIIP